MRKKEKKKRAGLYLPESLLRQLRDHKQATGIPASQFVERATRQALQAVPAGPSR